MDSLFSADLEQLFVGYYFRHFLSLIRFLSLIHFVAYSDNGVPVVCSCLQSCSSDRWEHCSSWLVELLLLAVVQY